MTVPRISIMLVLPFQGELVQPWLHPPYHRHPYPRPPDFSLWVGQSGRRDIWKFWGGWIGLGQCQTVPRQSWEHHQESCLPWELFHGQSLILSQVFNEFQYNINIVGSMISGDRRLELSKSFFGSCNQGMLTYCIPCVFISNVIFTDSQDGCPHNWARNTRII